MSSLTVPISPDLSPACRAGNTAPGTVPAGREMYCVAVFLGYSSGMIVLLSSISELRDNGL